MNICRNYLVYNYVEPRFIASNKPETFNFYIIISAISRDKSRLYIKTSI